MEGICDLIPRSDVVHSATLTAKSRAPALAAGRVEPVGIHLDLVDTQLAEHLACRSRKASALPWDKTENWLIAAQMRASEIEGTDVGDFLKNL